MALKRHLIIHTTTLPTATTASSPASAQTLKSQHIPQSTKSINSTPPTQSSRCTPRPLSSPLSSASLPQPQLQQLLTSQPARSPTQTDSSQPPTTTRAQSRTTKSLPVDVTSTSTRPAVLNALRNHRAVLAVLAVSILFHHTLSCPSLCFQFPIYNHIMISLSTIKHPL